MLGKKGWGRRDSMACAYAAVVELNGWAVVHVEPSSRRGRSEAAHRLRSRQNPLGFRTARPSLFHSVMCARPPVAPRTCMVGAVFRSTSASIPSGPRAEASVRVRRDFKAWASVPSDGGRPRGCCGGEGGKDAEGGRRKAASKRGSLSGRDGLTPGASPDLDSCMRTLIVSSGWQHSCGAPKERRGDVSEDEPSRPASTAAQKRWAHRFHRARDPSSSQLSGEPDGLLVSGARHGGPDRASVLLRGAEYMRACG